MDSFLVQHPWTYYTAVFQSISYGLCQLQQRQTTDFGLLETLASSFDSSFQTPFFTNSTDTRHYNVPTMRICGIEKFTHHYLVDATYPY